MDTNELRRIPIHSSLHRPDLLFGCERRLVLVAGLVCLILVVVVLTPLAALLGVLTWFAAIAALRATAKIDPIMSQVYLHHIRYQKYYPAKPTLYRPPVRYTRGENQVR